MAALTPSIPSLPKPKVPLTLYNAWPLTPKPRPAAANAIAGDDVPEGDEGAGGHGVSCALAEVGRGLGSAGTHCAKAMTERTANLPHATFRAPPPRPTGQVRLHSQVGARGVVWHPQLVSVAPPPHATADRFSGSLPSRGATNSARKRRRTEIRTGRCGFDCEDGR